jgi:glucosamine-6-phosphate deaminase
VGREAADLVVEILRAALARRGRAVLVPSTGRTVIRSYALLAARHRGALDWGRVEVFQMDELAGVPEALSARSFLAAHLVDPLGIRRVRLLREATAGEVGRVEEELVAAGPDLVIHGMGENGHLGLNEPGSPFDGAAREVALDEDTRRSKRGQLAGLEPPAHGLTLGLGVLLGAPRSLLLATGEHKRRALERALFRPASPAVPASGIQLRGRVTVIADRAALPSTRPSPER